MKSRQASAERVNCSPGERELRMAAAPSSSATSTHQAASHRELERQFH
jgi:hypothetical protein